MKVHDLEAFLERGLAAQRAAAAAANAGPACRECGCTDERACIGGCTWVETDLCSACAAPVSSELGAKVQARLVEAVRRELEQRYGAGDMAMRAVARLDLALPEPVLRVKLELELVIPADNLPT